MFKKRDRFRQRLQTAALFLVSLCFSASADAQEYYPYEYSAEAAPYPGFASELLTAEGTSLELLEQEALVIPYEAFRVALNSPENEDFTVTVFDEENLHGVRTLLSNDTTRGISAEFSGEVVGFNHHLFIVPLDARFSDNQTRLEFKNYLVVAGQLSG